jgi:hypothetical protein
LAGRRIHQHCLARRFGIHCNDPGEKYSRVNCWIANPDLIRLSSKSQIANIYIVVACSKKAARTFTQGNVVIAGGVALQRAIPDSSVVDTCRVFEQYECTTGRIRVTNCVREQRA